MRRFQITTILLLGTLAAFLTGCSRNPVSPDTSSLNQAAPAADVQTDDPTTDVSGGDPGTATGTFDPTVEGRLTVGRFTLDLHKNTLKMPAKITLHVENEASMEVEIEVVPAEANDFQVPAQLYANLSDLPNTNYETAWMFYWDGVWEEAVDGSAHPNQQNVVAHLTHLSACRVGDRDAKKNKMTE